MTCGLEESPGIPFPEVSNGIHRGSWTPILRCVGIPDADIGIQASGHDTPAVEGDGVDLAEVSLQCLDAAALRDAPDLRSSVVTTRHDNVSLDLEAPDASLVPHKHISAESRSDIPYPQRRIARARYRRVGIRHLQAADCRGVTAEGV